MTDKKYQLYFKDPETGEFVELKGVTVDSIQIKGNEEKNPEEYYIGLLTETPEVKYNYCGTLIESDKKFKEVSKENTNYSRVHGKGILRYNFNDYGETGSYINLEDIIFNEPTYDWGLIKAIGIFEKETGGELIAYKHIFQGGNHSVMKGDGAPRILKGQLKF